MSQTFIFAGSLSRVLITGDATGGAYAVLRNTQPPGNATPPHLHERDTEAVFVLSGVLTIETEGRRRDVDTGEAAVLPSGRPHRLSNSGAAPAEYLLLCRPAGFERFVAEAGEPAAESAPSRPMTDDERRRLADLAPRYGIRLLPDDRLRAGPEVAAVDATTPEWLDVVGLSLEVLVELGACEHDPVLLRATLPPRAAIPLHAHPEAETFVVLDGCLDVYVDGEWRSGGPGTVLPVTGGATHAIRNGGDELVVTICVTTAPLLAFFRDAAEPVGAEPPGPPSPARLQRLAAIALAHGQSFAEPEKQAAAGLPFG